VSGLVRARGPTLLGKLLRLDWPVILLILAIASVGFLLLFAAGGGSMEPWAGRQMTRFAIGFVGMIVVALIDIRWWRLLTPVLYLVGIGLLVAVELVGVVGMGAQRWIDLGPIQLQPSELMKTVLVATLAAYYAWLPAEKVSRPLWLLPPIALTLLPVALTLAQPDLGTAMLMAAGAGAMVFLAGVHWLYFAVGIGGVAGAVQTVMASRGTDWQLLEDYQFRRIEVFLDPETDPLGAGYHITQAKIALGAGGLTGRGFMEGTQSRLDFLPEKHTDFIFTTFAEDFGFVGGMALLALYGLTLAFCLVSTLQNRDRFGALLTAGIGATFFFAFAVNMAMVMGMAPVGGKPLPLVSYGGSSLMVMLFSFGLAQSAHVHRPR
jgi:rod shape determining protein RodA